MKDERGQALILVLVAMVALLAIVGLALDGGQAHASRRQAQNAADAAAMAGGQELLAGLCSTASDSDVRDAVVRYVRQNDVQVDPANPGDNIHAWYVDAYENRLGTVGAGSIPGGTRGVEVTVRFTETTHFMRIVGENNFQSFGAAISMVGPITQLPAGSTVLPVAVPDDAVADIPPDTDFYLDNDHFCKVHNDQCIGDAGDTSAMRGWLNFDYIYNIEYYEQNDPLRRTHSATFNAAALVDLIDGTRETPPIFLGTPPIPPAPEVPTIVHLDGDYIHGEPGQKQSANHAIFDNWAGQTVFAPVFDVVYAPNEMDDRDSDFPDPYVDSGQTWPNQNQYIYHIIGFAAIEVCEPGVDPGCGNNEKDLKGTFKRVIYGGQIDPTQPVPCDASLVGVVLWK